MAKLIQLEEAANMLGISPDELTEMRSRNEIFGYRDGASWKFKVAELERVAEDKGLTLGSADAPSASADEILSLDGDSTNETDSILVSDEELGQSDETTASTIIGEADDLIPKESSDLQIEGGSELRLAAGSKSGASDEIEFSTGSSDDVLSDEAAQPGPSDTANLDIASSSIGDELSLSADSGSLELSLDDLSNEGGSELRLGDSQVSSNSGFGSAIDLDLDDDDLVLGSGSGSDVTSGAGDSGINLANPSDSGLSLEEPLELTGGSGGELLELGEDEMISAEDASVEELQSDDDFLLTPVEDGMEDESDSGSQVIDTLEPGDFEDSAADMLTEADEGLVEETMEFTDDESPIGLTPAAAPVGAAAIAADSLEAPYTIWNVLSLFFIVAFLGFTGILMLDLMNNIWSWQGNYSFNSTIMDGILAMLPGSK